MKERTGFDELADPLGVTFASCSPNVGHFILALMLSRLLEEGGETEVRSSSAAAT